MDDGPEPTERGEDLGERERTGHKKITVNCGEFIDRESYEFL